MKNPRAFTLIELLVVIAIIALLLSIMVPALSMAKEKAHNLLCRTNVRALSLGFRVYAESNDGKIFGYGSGGSNNLWLMQIADMLGEVDKVRYCPSTKRNPTPIPIIPPDNNWGSASETWIWLADVTEPEHGSFGINGYFYSSTSPSYVPAAEWEASAWGNVNVAGRASAIPVFVDSIWVDFWLQDDDVVPAGHDLETGDDGGNGATRNHMLRCMVDRHGGKLSVAFLDGHVEPVALKKMWSLKWSKGFKTDSEDHLRSDGTPIYKK